MPYLAIEQTTLHFSKVAPRENANILQSFSLHILKRGMKIVH